MIKARVVYTMEHMKQLRRLRILTYIFMGACTLWTLFIYFLILSIPLICFITREPLPDGFWGQMIMMTAVSLGIILLDIWVFYLEMWIGFRKKKKKYGDSPIFYEIDENGVKVESHGEGFSENVSFAYDKLDKAIETKKYFLLCPRRNAAYIIGKHEITEGSVKALSELLRLKMGNKFKGK